MRSRSRGTTPPSISCTPLRISSTPKCASSRQSTRNPTKLLTPAQADELIAQHLTCLPIESLPLAQCAGAVLRENIYAERDQPPFDRVTMDGIALDSRGVRDGARRLRIQAMQAAGDPPLTLAGRDHCIEVMTGTVLPAGCDAVVPVERITV